MINKKYALHDTEINKVTIHNGGIELHLDNGVYLVDDNGKEMEFSAPCRVSIVINTFNFANVWEHITIMKFRKSKVKEIDFDEFLKLLNVNSFDITMEYYSLFGAAMLFKGYIGKYGIEVAITEIEKVEYVFDN